MERETLVKRTVKHNKQLFNHMPVRLFFISVLKNKTIYLLLTLTLSLSFSDGAVHSVFE